MEFEGEIDTNVPGNTDGNCTVETIHFPIEWMCFIGAIWTETGVNDISFFRSVTNVSCDAPEAKR